MCTKNELKAIVETWTKNKLQLYVGTATKY